MRAHRACSSCKQNLTGQGCCAGKCASEIDAFCKDVTPGEGRLSKCLTDQFQEEMQDKYTGPRVSEACHNEVDAFKQDRASNINKDLPLGGSLSCSSLGTP